MREYTLTVTLNNVTKSEKTDNPGLAIDKFFELCTKLDPGHYAQTPEDYQDRIPSGVMLLRNIMYRNSKVGEIKLCETSLKKRL